MDIREKVRCRVKMFGGRTDDSARLDYCVKRAITEAKDFCNAHGFPDEAEFYLIDWAAANYLTETDGYSRQWERLREDAERGMTRFRRMRW